ncbi:hypothetical protein MRX96_038109, partial [Rhipicephalus microplus]
HGLGPLTLARPLGPPPRLCASARRCAPSLATPVLETCSRRRSFTKQRLENFCLVTGVAADATDTRGYRLPSRVARSCGGGSCAGSTRGEQFTAAFRSSSRRWRWRRLKAELEQRTQHPEENLKEFIYAIATFYDRIGEEVSEAEKVQRVLRQMHPQLQDLAEGHAYNDLAELVKAADGLMKRAWRPPPVQTTATSEQPSSQISGVPP